MKKKTENNQGNNSRQSAPPFAGIVFPLIVAGGFMHFFILIPGVKAAKPDNSMRKPTTKQSQKEADEEGVQQTKQRILNSQHKSSLIL